MNKRNLAINLYTNLINLTRTAMESLDEDSLIPCIISSIESDLHDVAMEAKASKEEYLEDMTGNSDDFYLSAIEAKADDLYHETVISWINERTEEIVAEYNRKLAARMNDSQLPDWTFSSGFDQGGSY